MFAKEAGRQLAERTHASLESGRNRGSPSVSHKRLVFASLSTALVLSSIFSIGSGQAEMTITGAGLVTEGKQISRFDTFGDQSQRTDAARKSSRLPMV
jgi:hypothetical protein